MIPVVQTKVVVCNTSGDIVVNGNCWAAAIASILELPITEVPNFEVWFQEQWPLSFWYRLTERFLYLKGYKLSNGVHFKCFHISKEQWEADFSQDIEQVKNDLKDKYYFVSGPSPRGVSHVTIWQNGKMVHDPHPTREGILKLETFEVIEPLTDEEKTILNNLENWQKIIFPTIYKNQ